MKKSQIKENQLFALVIAFYAVLFVFIVLAAIIAGTF
jgi:hypothetical protein